MRSTIRVKRFIMALALAAIPAASGCDAFQGFIAGLQNGGAPAGNPLPTVASDSVLLVMENRSGEIVSVHASFANQGQSVRDTRKILTASGIESTAELLRTVSEQITVVAQVADPAILPSARLQPGEVLAQQQYQLGTDYQGGDTIRFIVPPAFADCNGNGVPDDADIAAGTSRDCNLNGVPDECDIAGGINVDCNSNGQLRGLVRDAVTGQGLPGAGVRIFTSGRQIAQGTTGPNGTYQFTLPPGTYDLEISKSGYLTTMYYAAMVSSNQPTDIETVQVVDAQHTGPGGIGGVITNALTGRGLSGVTVNLRPGLNARTGPATATGLTDESGNYGFSSIAAGQYTADLSKTGYVTAYLGVVVVGGTTTANQNGSMAPILPEGELRIVLTWAESPSDLDSHLTGPLSDGSRFHVYFADRGDLSSEPYASLDIDDTSSFGPETITVTQPRAGVYRYTVHDYSNSDATYSTYLAASGARVQVFNGSNLLATFSVPTGDGTAWKVFEIDGATGKLTPFNTLFYSADSGGIPFAPPATDAGILLDLPNKK